MILLVCNFSDDSLKALHILMDARVRIIRKLFLLNIAVVRIRAIKTQIKEMR